MSSDDDDISGYLNSLRREGHYESTGSFSLAAQKSLEKLKQFQLLQKEQYILHLVSAASLRGATQIQFDIGANDLRMAFDGQPFSQAELDDVFSSYFRTDTSPQNQSRKDLAIALNTITTFNPDFVVVESWRGKEGAVMQLYEEQVWLETLTASSPRPNQGSFQYICFQTPLSFLNYCLPSFVMGARAEFELLKTRCCYGPARVWVNGSPLEPQGRCRLVQFHGEGGAPPFMNLSQKDAPSVSGPLWGFLRVNRFGQISRLLTFVVGGVSFSEKARADLFPPDTQVVVYADHLKKDLSQQALVANEELESVRQQAAKLALQAAEIVLRTKREGVDDLKRWYEARSTPVGKP